MQDAEVTKSLIKLERVGQRSSPTSVCDLRGGPRGIAGLLVCPFASVALICIVALLADRSGSTFAFKKDCESLRILADPSESIFAFLRIIVDSC